MSAINFGLFVAIIFAILVNIHLSQQVSISTSIDSMPNKSTNDTTNYWKNLIECIKNPLNKFTNCLYTSSIITLDKIIENNDTWHLTNYIALKKNINWRSTKFVAREIQSPIDYVITKITDLLTCRSLQFILPNENEEMFKRTARYVFGSDDAVDNIGVGKKYSEMKNTIEKKIYINVRLY